jgi:hypothetical protein
VGSGHGGGDEAALRERRLGAPELLRLRARSVSTLLATASGVLIAGVAFSASNPASTLSTPVRAWGAAAAGCFVLATSIYVAASTRHKVKKGTGGLSDPSLFEVADALTTSVRRLIRGGAIMAMIGVAVLGAALCASFVTPYDTSVVTVQLAVSPAPEAVEYGNLRRVCPGLPDQFGAEIPDRDIAGGGNLIQMKPFGGWCQGSTVFVPRQGVVALTKP